MKAAMNPWYTAWLKPDCMVGANTKSRKDLAANRDISDNFKQRLRACMDPAEYDRLTAGGGAVPVARAASNSVEALSPNPGSVRPPRRATTGVQTSQGPQRRSVGVQGSLPERRDTGVQGSAPRRKSVGVQMAPSLRSAGAQTPWRVRSRRQLPEDAARFPISLPDLDLASRSRARSRSASPGWVVDADGAINLVSSSQSRSPAAARAPTPVPRSRSDSPQISTVNTQRGSLNNSVAREILEGANEVVDRVQRDRASPAPRRSRTRDSPLPDLGPEPLEPAPSWDGSNDSLVRRIIREGAVKRSRPPSTRRPSLKRMANDYVLEEHAALQEEADQKVRENDREGMRGVIEAIQELLAQSEGQMFKNTRLLVDKLLKRCRDEYEHGLSGGPSGAPGASAPAAARRRRRTDGDVQRQWASMYPTYRDLVRDAVKRKDREECARILEDLTDILSTYGSQLQKRTRLQYEKLRDKCSANASRSSGSAQHSSAEIGSAEQRRLTDAAIELRNGNRQERQHRMADLERFAEDQRGRGSGSNSETDSQIRRRVTERTLLALRRRAGTDSSTSASSASRGGGRLRQQVSFSDSDNE